MSHFEICCLEQFLSYLLSVEDPTSNRCNILNPDFSVELPVNPFHLVRPLHDFEGFSFLVTNELVVE